MGYYRVCCKSITVVISHLPSMDKILIRRCQEDAL